jgi:hypothetical protein
MMYKQKSLSVLRSVQNTKRNPLYISKQSLPRYKLFPPHIEKTIS